MVDPKQLPPSPCFYGTRKKFVVIALVVDHSLIYLGRTKVSVSISWGFMLVIPHTSTYFRGYPHFSPLGTGILKCTVTPF